MCLGLHACTRNPWSRVKMISNIHWSYCQSLCVSCWWQGENMLCSDIGINVWRGEKDLALFSHKWRNWDGKIFPLSMHTLSIFSPPHTSVLGSGQNKMPRWECFRMNWKYFRTWCISRDFLDKPTRLPLYCNNDQAIMSIMTRGVTQEIGRDLTGKL